MADGGAPAGRRWRLTRWRHTRRRRWVAAATAAAAACVATTAATIGATSGSLLPSGGGAPSPPPWSWSFEGGNLSSGSAKAQTPGTVTNVGEVTSWAAPSGLYLLLAPGAPERTAFVRWDSGASSWVTLRAVNESTGDYRGVTGVRGNASAVPPVLWGAAPAVDGGGRLGGRLWVYGGTEALAPFRTSTALYEFDPAGGGGGGGGGGGDGGGAGTWARLDGGSVNDPFGPCNNGGPRAAPSAVDGLGRQQKLLVDAPRSALLLANLVDEDEEQGGTKVLDLWRYGLGLRVAGGGGGAAPAAAAAPGWSRLEPTGTAPRLAGTPPPFDAVVAGDTLFLFLPYPVVDGGAIGATEVWTVSPLSGGPPAWTRLAPPSAVGAGLALGPYGSWWDGSRFFFAYTPGDVAAADTTDGVGGVANVPGLTFTRRPRAGGRASTGAPAVAMAPVDRWYVFDTHTARGRVWEAPSLSTARPRGTSPAAPPPTDEGARVRRGAAPLQRTEPVTGGALLSDGGGRLYGYLQGGLVAGYQQVGLLRVEWDRAALVAAFRSDAPSPPVTAGGEGGAPPPETDAAETPPAGVEAQATAPAHPAGGAQASPLGTEGGEALPVETDGEVPPVASAEPAGAAHWTPPPAQVEPPATAAAEGGGKWDGGPAASPTPAPAYKWEAPEGAVKT